MALSDRMVNILALLDEHNIDLEDIPDKKVGEMLTSDDVEEYINKIRTEKRNEKIDDIIEDE